MNLCVENSNNFNIINVFILVQILPNEVNVLARFKAKTEVKNTHPVKISSIWQGEVNSVSDIIERQVDMKASVGSNEASVGTLDTIQATTRKP